MNFARGPAYGGKTAKNNGAGNKKGSVTKKKPCAAAERTKRLKQGLAITGKGHWLVDAEACAKLLGEVEPSDLAQFPWEICTHVTVTGYSENSCW